MSTIVAGLPAHPLPLRELSLTGVAVTFLADRPVKRVKLSIKLEGKNREVMIDDDGPLEWKGKLRCLENAKITICIHRRRSFRCWEQFAVAETSLTEHPSPLTDFQNLINIILTVCPPQGGGLRTVGPDFPKTTTIVPEFRNDNIRIWDAVVAGAARDKVTYLVAIMDNLGKIWNILELLIKIPLEEIYPTLRKARFALGYLITQCEMRQSCVADASNLIERLVPFISIKRHIKVLPDRVESRQALKDMLEAIFTATTYILVKTSPGIIGSEIQDKHRNEIARLRKDFARAKEAFDRSVQLEIFTDIDDIEPSFLGHSSCIEGTRADVCRSVEKWIHDIDPAHPNLFWLYGNAGSGKSAVSTTVAMMIDIARGDRLSCFFCKRDDSSSSNPRKLFPTLAYRFAQQDEGYRAIILELLGDGGLGPDIATTVDIGTQLDKLFKEPLSRIDRSMKATEPLRPHVVVIDALDECGTSDKEHIELATNILSLSRTVPWIKVFVTSRDEPAIHDVFSSTECIPYDLNLENGADHDIRLYIKTAALALQLSDVHVNKLVEQVKGQFIWYRTLFEHLRGAPDANSFLDELLSSETPYDPSDPSDWLYELYDKIFDSALGPREENVMFMRATLSIIIAAAPNRPLSAKAAIHFLRGHELHSQFSAEDVERVVKKLDAVLYVDSVNGAIRARHSSFYDFITWKATSSSEPGWEKSGAIHRLIALNCIDTLHEELAFNICKIDIPVLNKDIPDLATRITTHMSEALQYSSRFWFIHLALSTLTAADVMADVLKLLCSMKLLFWLECLSLQGFLRPDMLIFWTNVTKFFQEYPTVIVTTEDIHKFVTSFADAMDSVPHIYMSALFWIPEGSLTYQNLELSTKKNWHLINNDKKNWEAFVRHRLYNINVQSVIFSPQDSQSVAYSLSDGHVYIWNLKTDARQELPISRNPNLGPCHLAYSYDGRFILGAGSLDQTLHRWDMRSSSVTKAELFLGHDSGVSCVAYSPDGLFVASGSYDDTIQILNTETGKLASLPLRHPSYVLDVAYSPDGRFIASGCGDRCLHIWDTKSFKEAKTKPLRGHLDAVSSIAYSPDGNTIISGSWDKTIRRWNTTTGQAIGQPLCGHTDNVNSVTYSPNGSLILSGSQDGTIRLWDAESGELIGDPLKVHFGPVLSVSYSPDGSYIASASVDGICISDTLTCFVSTHHIHRMYGITYSPTGPFIASSSDNDQICIWNTETGAAIEQPELKHKGVKALARVQSLAYSPNGNFIASSSGDNTISIVDIRTGKTAIDQPFRGHSRRISAIAYSPGDGRLVASASTDGTIRLWDVQKAVQIGEPLQVHSSALSMAFSQNGSSFRVACGTADGAIWLWDDILNTEASIIQAHPRYNVSSVAFSPNGHYIASGSSDCSVQVWDIESGNLFLDPFQGHQEDVRCVAYSPDGCSIASCSQSQVIIWNAQDGSVRGKPLVGPNRHIQSVSYSPLNHFLASCADDRIYIHDVQMEPEAHRWQAVCSQMNLQDGWVREGEMLLLWIPAHYQEALQSCAHAIIPNQAQNIVASRVDYRSLFRYSGREWTEIFRE